jgi:hypothetical protein
MGRCHTEGCSQPTPDSELKAAARDREEWRKKVGEAMAQKTCRSAMEEVEEEMARRFLTRWNYY